MRRSQECLYAISGWSYCMSDVLTNWYNVCIFLFIYLGLLYYLCFLANKDAQSSHVYQNYTNSVPIVKNSQKTVKQQKMTIRVPIVTCLHRVRRIHKAAQTPLPRETAITCPWAVATARRPWAGLTVCVYMDVHVSGSRSLPRAATLSSTYWWCLQLVYSLSTTVIKFSIFSNPTRKLSALSPELRRIR